MCQGHIMLESNIKGILFSEQKHLRYLHISLVNYDQSLLLVSF